MRAINLISSFALLVLAASACTRKSVQEELSVKKLNDTTLELSTDAIKNITIKKVLTTAFPEELSIMGRINVPEDRVAVIPARVAGRIDAVYVSSGEIVARGQPMASLFSADFVVAKEEYLQALEQAKSTGDSESKHLLELSKKKLEALGMNDGDIEQLAANGRPKSENLIIRAPQPGALLDKKAVVGTMVNQGDTLFTVGDLNKVWFAGDVYPEDLKKLHKNQDVIIESASSQKQLHGKVSFISPVVDPNTRTIKIRALMDNSGSQLRGDMYVQGNVILNTHQALVAPKSALIRVRDSFFAFRRVPGSNRFERIEVQYETQTGDSVAIQSGLKDGDEVVSEGALLLDAALTGETS